MRTKWVYWVITGMSVLSLTLFTSGAPRGMVNAMPNLSNGVEVYFPLFARVDPPHSGYDDFEDQDPEWFLMKTKEPKDGFFEHLDGRLRAHIRDNAARMVASPIWQPQGDFKLEVKGRFQSNDWMNSLGLAFGGNGDWSEYYDFKVAFNFAQHHWAVARIEGKRVRYLTDPKWRGGPSFMRDYYNWNRLMVVRRQNEIQVYCNDKLLPGGTVTDSHYGPNRLVGLTVTSYEWDYGEIEFDNFRLTPLSTSD